MTDPRRKLIAEAMEARTAIHANPPASLSIRADSMDDARFVRPVADFVAAAHNALPAAVELIEICEAANAELVDRVKYAEATIATQAKEIERLRGAEPCLSCGLSHPWHEGGCHFCPDGNPWPGTTEQEEVSL